MNQPKRPDQLCEDEVNRKKERKMRAAAIVHNCVLTKAEKAREGKNCPLSEWEGRRRKN